MKKILFLICLTIAVQAGNPKVFASIGDPIYHAVKPVRTLATLKSFRKDKALFNTFLTKAAAAYKEGKWIDAHKQTPEAKRRSKSYLAALRHLQQINAQITETVRSTLETAIKKQQRRRYFRIKKTGYPALINDAALHRKMAAYESRLHRQQKRDRRLKAQREAAYLRSYGNLRGEWRAKSSTGKETIYRFDSPEKLTIVSRSPSRMQTLVGAWHISNDTLNIALSSITNTMEDGVPHERDTDVKLHMKIRSIGTKKLKLYDMLRKKEQTFFRYDND
jgi:hypothetical protein